MDPLPPLLRDSAFLVRDAILAGVRDRQLRPGVLPTPHHGIRSSLARPGIFGRCLELLPVVGQGHAFSHITAAALWGLPLPRGVETGDLHVQGVDDLRPRRPGVVGHRTRVVRGAFIDILPVVDAITAWLQSAAFLPLDDVIIMGDALAGRWSPFEPAREIPLEQLAAAVSTWGSRPGARRLRQALPWVRSNVWSPRETELRLVIVRGGLPEPPELNAEITDAEGRVLGHGDLVYRRQKKVIEYEGDQHRSDRGQWRLDVRRYENFQDAGWRVIRVTDDDLATPRILVSRLSRHIGQVATG